jgi:hypothetical protein
MNKIRRRFLWLVGNLVDRSFAQRLGSWALNSWRDHQLYDLIQLYQLYVLVSLD